MHNKIRLPKEVLETPYPTTEEWQLFKKAVSESEEYIKLNRVLDSVERKMVKAFEDSLKPTYDLTQAPDIGVFIKDMKRGTQKLLWN